MRSVRLAAMAMCTECFLTRIAVIGAFLLTTAPGERWPGRAPWSGKTCGAARTLILLKLGVRRKVDVFKFYLGSIFDVRHVRFSE